jgi:predicted transcriptional regulator
MDTKVMTAEVSAELADRVDAFAEQMHLTSDSIVEQALAAWIRREDWKHQATLEGLADVDAGRVIDHEAMLAWAESLATDTPLPPPLPK